MRRLLCVLLPLGLASMAHAQATNAAPAAPAAAAPAASAGETPLGPVQAPDPEKVIRGQAQYQRYCQACHGPYGDGRGDSFPYLDTKPRDFTKGIFKFRSTPSGTLPADSDLFHTIRNGLWGSFMPRWSGLGDDQIWDLIAYVESFFPGFSSTGRGIPITIPPEPPDTPESQAAGKQVYTQMGCFNCHGVEGRGNGPSANTLVDDWGFPIQPANLTLGHYKAGDLNSDIYKDFMTGLNGTPMPSYVDSMTPAQAWDLVHYIRTLVNEDPFFKQEPSLEQWEKMVAK
jgi:cytochrome c oxidase cbb3-type subunit 2